MFLFLMFLIVTIIFAVGLWTIAQNVISFFARIMSPGHSNNQRK